MAEAGAHPAHGAVLLLIDLQKAIDHPSWGVRNNPDAEAHLAALLALWRGKGWPVWHVRHDSVHATSHYGRASRCMPSGRARSRRTASR